MSIRMSVAVLAAGLAATSLVACSNQKPFTSGAPGVQNVSTGGSGGGLLGDDGLVLFGMNTGGKKTDQAASGGSAMSVNAYLWRATLETLSFMPLTSADPFGGVIITDWYQPPSGSGERFKATAYILGRQLRADGVRVSIFRQVQQGGQWVDAPVAPATTGEIENKVLARARELRAESAAAN